MLAANIPLPRQGLSDFLGKLGGPFYLRRGGGRPERASGSTEPPSLTPASLALSIRAATSTASPASSVPARPGERRPRHSPGRDGAGRPPARPGSGWCARGCPARRAAAPRCRVDHIGEVRALSIACMRACKSVICASSLSCRAKLLGLVCRARAYCGENPSTSSTAHSRTVRSSGLPSSRQMARRVSPSARRSQIRWASSEV